MLKRTLVHKSGLRPSHGQGMEGGELPLTAAATRDGEAWLLAVIVLSACVHSMLCLSAVAPVLFRDVKERDSEGDRASRDTTQHSSILYDWTVKLL